jgi:hypothetical protein
LHSTIIKIYVSEVAAARSRGQGRLLDDQMGGAGDREDYRMIGYEEEEK